MKLRTSFVLRIALPLIIAALCLLLAHLALSQSGRQTNGLERFCSTAGHEDQEFDAEAAGNYIRYHHPSSGIQSYDRIQFAGVFYEPADLEKVKYRIYHILDKDEIVACFYANYDTGVIEQSGNSPAPVFSLMNRLDLQGVEPKDIRFTTAGLDEAILIETCDGEYFFASLMTPELRSTGAKSLSAVSTWFERSRVSDEKQGTGRP